MMDMYAALLAQKERIDLLEQEMLRLKSLVGVLVDNTLTAMWDRVESLNRRMDEVEGVQRPERYNTPDSGLAEEEVIGRIERRIDDAIGVDSDA